MIEDLCAILSGLVLWSVFWAVVACLIRGVYHFILDIPGLGGEAVDEPVTAMPLDQLANTLENVSPKQLRALIMSTAMRDDDDDE
jgi:hypothetical protein